MKSIQLLLLAIFFVSCASTMPGQNVSTGSNDFSVTVKKHPDFSNETIQMYQLSIKNNTSSWLELDGAKLEGAKEVEVLVGDYVDSWIEACALEKKVSDYNLSLVLGSAAVGGVVVAGSTHHQRTATTGAILSMGTISAIAVNEYQHSKNKVDFQKAFPEKHIFQPSKLPPKKVVQRWILVENRKHENFKLSFGEGLAVTIEGNKSY